MIPATVRVMERGIISLSRAAEPRWKGREVHWIMEVHYVREKRASEERMYIKVATTGCGEPAGGTSWTRTAPMV